MQMNPKRSYTSPLPGLAPTLAASYDRTPVQGSCELGTMLMTGAPPSHHSTIAPKSGGSIRGTRGLSCQHQRKEGRPQPPLDHASVGLPQCTRCLTAEAQHRGIHQPLGPPQLPRRCQLLSAQWDGLTVGGSAQPHGCALADNHLWPLRLAVHMQHLRGQGAMGLLACLTWRDARWQVQAVQGPPLSE